MKLLHDFERSSSRRSMKLTSGNHDSMVLGRLRPRTLGFDGGVCLDSEGGDVCIEGDDDGSSTDGETATRSSRDWLRAILKLDGTLMCG